MSYLNQLCSSNNPQDMIIIELNINKLDCESWKLLCENPEGFYIIKKYIQHYGIGFFNKNYYLKHLCKNKNAIELIELYMNYLDSECINNLYLNKNGAIVINKLKRT